MGAPAVWRTALRPRWLALLAVVAVLCVAFGWLGHWQLDVARSKDKPHHPPAAAAAVPLEQVVQPQQVFRTDMVGRAVTVTGTYVGDQQVLVSGKRQDGADGFWVVAPLRVASGALVPVVRGFVKGTDGSATSPQAVPVASGVTTVSGTLQPPDPVADQASAPPAGQIPAADTADLVNRWGGPIYNVLVYAAAAPAAGDTVALTPVPAPPPDDGGGLGLRNAAYAVQWWLFAAFALLLWWRMVRQDAIDVAAAAAAEPHPIKEPSTP